jgi:hypothetical protein
MHAPRLIFFDTSEHLLITLNRLFPKKDKRMFATQPDVYYPCKIYITKDEFKSFEEITLYTHSDQSAANPLETADVPRSMFAAHTGLLYDRVWVVSDGFLLGAQSSRLKPKFGSRTFCAHHLPGGRRDESKGQAAGGGKRKEAFCAPPLLARIPLHKPSDTQTNMRTRALMSAHTPAHEHRDAFKSKQTESTSSLLTIRQFDFLHSYLFPFLQFC